jgi:hypothetical protein
MIHFPSWPGFVPAIHVFLLQRRQDVDARHKAGHDEPNGEAQFDWTLFRPDSQDDGSVAG